MDDEQLTIVVAPGSECVTLRLTGEIDLSTAPLVRDAGLAATRQPVPSIRFDLSGVTFMDLTGLEALLATRRRAARDGIQIHLIDPRRNVMRVLEATRTARLFTITRDETSEQVA
jgi:anti-sigma B factor antagonist